jgi:hypothetical protein
MNTPAITNIKCPTEETNQFFSPKEIYLLRSGQCMCIDNVTDEA